MPIPSHQTSNSDIEHLAHPRPSNSSFLIFTCAFGVKFPHRQRRATSYVCVRCLGLVIAPLESTFFRFVIRRPRGASSIRLQESCDLFFGKIGALDVRIPFQNASALSEDYEVKISILVVSA